MKAFLTAGLALATCAAFAAIEKQTFDSMDVGPIPAGNAVWSGEGTVGTKTGTGVSGKSLAVAGTVICSNDTSVAAVSEFVKTSFQVKAPEEGTETSELPTGAEVADCQIAVATGAAGTGADADKLKVMVYAGSTPAWTDTGLKVTTNDWFDVTLSFDYSGSPKTAKVQIGNAVAGPFILVTPPASATAKINSLNFVGAAEIDDVLIDEALTQESLASSGLEGMHIYTNELGVTQAEIADPVTTYGDMTVADRIVAGLAPKDETTFTATALATTDDGQVGITVPRVYDNGQVYSVVVTEDGVERTVSNVTPELGDGSVTLKVMPATGTKVIKLQVKAKAPGALN